MERMMEYMPTDLQYKDDLRRQRDDWSEVLENLEKVESKEDVYIENAKKKAARVLARINESLQD